MDAVAGADGANSRMAREVVVGDYTRSSGQVGEVVRTGHAEEWAGHRDGGRAEAQLPSMLGFRRRTGADE